MTETNFFTTLRNGFPADLDAVAVEAEDGLKYSWRDLDEITARMANLLASLRLPADSRIAVQVDKSVEAMALYLATLRAGYVFLPLNTAYQSAEIEYFLSDAEPAVVVCGRKNVGWIRDIAGKNKVRRVFTLNNDRTGTLLEHAAPQSDQYQVVHRKGSDLAAILYTSGTTGRSKGAMLTHGNMQSNALTLKDYWGWQPSDVLIHVLPIFHVHGLFVAIHGALLSGSKMIWFNKFDPRRVIASLPDATVFMGVPTLYVRMLAEANLTKDGCQNMRLFISGSAPLLPETFVQWHERTGHTILERYGMSETLMLTSNPCGLDARHAGQAERRAGTVGFPLPGVELRICDSTGRPVPAGEIGAIQVNGPNVFSGYWRMPEKTREEFTSDGFFKTGDVGKIDERGYVSIVGRDKDLIISGGYNIYPAEVEGYINEIEGVAESALIGVPHGDFGEVGVALVVPEKNALLDADAILATLKGRLAHFKVPKTCHVVAELPRNTMGKVQKNVLREEYKKEFLS